MGRHPAGAAPGAEERQRGDEATPLTATFTNRRAAERVASNFRRSKPEALGPGAKGSFQARAYETEGSKWGVIVWYDESTP